MTVTLCRPIKTVVQPLKTHKEFKYLLIYGEGESDNGGVSKLCVYVYMYMRIYTYYG